MQQELRRICQAHNDILHPKDVVDAARPKSSPLHSQFEWDNTAAGEKYRLHQARQLISVYVEVSVYTKKTVRVFVNLRKNRHKGGGYLPLKKVLSDKQLRRQLLADALKDLEYFEQKYHNLHELSQVFAAVRTVRAQHTKEPLRKAA